MTDLLRRPGFWPILGVLALLTALVLAPLLAILAESFGASAWRDVLASPLSRNLFWRPLGTTLLIGGLTAAGCLMLGGFLAWLTVMTDVPFRRLLGFLASLPFMIPSFAAALAWSALFRNERLGGEGGLLQGLGFAVPDWLAWGILPTILVLIAHYHALAFVAIAAALASADGELLDAARMTGASRRRILFGILLPMVSPALLAGAALSFAGAVSNFATPALLGLPVRMQTLSTRLYGMIEIGQTERGYVLALLLIGVAGVFLGFGDRLLAGRRSFAVVSGKGGRRARMALGRARWPLGILALALCALTTILPILLLVASSLAPRSSALFSGWTLRFWIGGPDPAFSRGAAGLFADPHLTRALRVTLGLGVGSALAATAVGFLVALVATRRPIPWLSGAAVQLAFLPTLLPGIALGAAFIALYGAPFGPLPALYGTPLLLGLALTASMTPFAFQSARATLAQISGELDEAARMAGAGALRRFLSIALPLASRGAVAGLLLCFVGAVGDLAVVALLYTPATPTLSVLAYRYASEGLHQIAHAATLVILLLSVLAALAAALLNGRKEPPA